MKIALLGDIATFGRFCLSNNSEVINYFNVVKKHLSEFDVVVGNLEAPFATEEGAIGGKSATVKSHPLNIKLLRHIGITHVNLANNHIGDFGIIGYERTKDILEDNDIDWFGTEDKQIEMEVNGEKIALLGFCSYNTNPSPVKSKSNKGLNYLDAHKVEQEIEKNSKRGLFNIVSIHSGQEHVHMPSSDDIKFARQIAEKFNYVYYGHHPHVIQGYEQINGSAIFYSLGNFIFDDVYTQRDKNKPLIKLSEANKNGLIAELEIKNGNLENANSSIVYMSEDRMLIGDHISGIDTSIYNAYLAGAGSSEYNEIRSSLISDYINSRRQMRDMRWYISRLNFNSVGILLKARKNLKLYKKHFLEKIDQSLNIQ